MEFEKRMFVLNRIYTRPNDKKKRQYRFCQVTPKGFNFIHVVSGVCMLDKNIYCEQAKRNANGNVPKGLSYYTFHVKDARVAEMQDVPESEKLDIKHIPIPKGFSFLAYAPCKEGDYVLSENGKFLKAGTSSPYSCIILKKDFTRTRVDFVNLNDRWTTVQSQHTFFEAYTVLCQIVAGTTLRHCNVDYEFLLIKSRLNDEQYVALGHWNDGLKEG